MKKKKRKLFGPLQKVYEFLASELYGREWDECELLCDEIQAEIDGLTAERDRARDVLRVARTWCFLPDDAREVEMVDAALADEPRRKL